MVKLVQSSSFVSGKPIIHCLYSLTVAVGMKPFLSLVVRVLAVTSFLFLFF